MSPFVGSGLARMVCVMSLGVLASAAPAAAHPGSATGGASYAPSEPPEVSGLACDDPADAGCPKGTQLRLKGEYLTSTDSVVFLGRRGTEDDLSTRPIKTSQHRVVVRIPGAARSGRVRAVVGDEAADGPRLKVLAANAAATPSSDSGVFPIRGKHSYGTETNRFGGGRGHQGQDIFAKCGERLVSALDGTVTLAKWQDRAGNYVVIKAEDGTSQAYMHMRGPALVEKGGAVRAGQRIGEVGDTGRASGCHLHFELWTAPGWYEGGTAIDPLATLKTWDAVS